MDLGLGGHDESPVNNRCELQLTSSEQLEGKLSTF
uniref:Uncharacterized protein n=1 Tax=Arundo donax TaxID=35708 RepID=A0A0A9B6Z9_ARUDO